MLVDGLLGARRLPIIGAGMGPIHESLEAQGQEFFNVGVIHEADPTSFAARALTGSAQTKR